MNNRTIVNNRIIFILYKKINKEELMPEEKKELDEWVERSMYNRLVLKEVMNEQILHEELKRVLVFDEEAGLVKLKQKMAEKKSFSKLVPLGATGRRFLYAAAVVLLAGCSLAAYFYFFNHKEKPLIVNTQPSEKNLINDIAPGSEKALLTLADGTTIPLDSVANGAIAQQGSTIVMKEDGLLAYNIGNTDSKQELLYNTISVPRGGEYRSLILADGTKVWLNAVSSIRFPAAFTGKERNVEITGEVYFEVAKNKSKPFKVKVYDMEVQVIGTHFNINAYQDENFISTTLLEGAVKINTGDKFRLLKPGQQARADKHGNIDIKENAELDVATAWKDGIFLFKKNDMESIMRQVSRWYDVDVVFEDKIPGHFVATIPRGVPVSKLLKIFQMAGGVHFEINDRKILVKL